MSISWELLVFGAVVVVGLIEWIKKFSWVQKLKKFFNWFPLVGAIIAGLAVSSYLEGALNVASWGLYSLGILSISVLGYQNIVEYVRNKVESVKTELNR